MADEKPKPKSTAGDAAPKPTSNDETAPKKRKLSIDANKKDQPPRK